MWVIWGWRPITAILEGKLNLGFKKIERYVKKNEQGHKFWLQVESGKKNIPWGRLLIDTGAKTLDPAGRIESPKYPKKKTWDWKAGRAKVSQETSSGRRNCVTDTNGSSTWSTTKRDNSSIICVGLFSHLQLMVNELSDRPQTPGSVKVCWHKPGCEQSGTQKLQPAWEWLAR